MGSRKQWEVLKLQFLDPEPLIPGNATECSAQGFGKGRLAAVGVDGARDEGNAGAFE
jgi:hypothetical protein